MHCLTIVHSCSRGWSNWISFHLPEKSAGYLTPRIRIVETHQRARPVRCRWRRDCQSHSEMVRRCFHPHQIQVQQGEPQLGKNLEADKILSTILIRRFRMVISEIQRNSYLE